MSELKLQTGHREFVTLESGVPYTEHAGDKELFTINWESDGTDNCAFIDNGNLNKQVTVGFQLASYRMNANPSNKNYSEEPAFVFPTIGVHAAFFDLKTGNAEACAVDFTGVNTKEPKLVRFDNVRPQEGDRIGPMIGADGAPMQLVTEEFRNGANSWMQKYTDKLGNRAIVFMPNRQSTAEQVRERMSLSIDGDIDVVLGDTPDVFVKALVQYANDMRWDEIAARPDLIRRTLYAHLTGDHDMLLLEGGTPPAVSDQQLEEVFDRGKSIGFSAVVVDASLELEMEKSAKQ